MTPDETDAKAEASNVAVDAAGLDPLATQPIDIVALS